LIKLDILVLAAHPDDAELGCGGTLALHISKGYKVGVVDLTQGELGTRGTAETREAEANESSKILGLTIRENLGLRDGFFYNGEADQLKVVSAIRQYQPEIVLTNAIKDRHPDHAKGANLVHDACFLSGLIKVITKDKNGNDQKPWRPKLLYHFIQSQYIVPDFIVDVSAHWETKIKCIKAFKTQFFDPDSKEPQTYISTENFLKMIESRGIEYGHSIGTSYGEGFTLSRPPGVRSLFDLM
jgi:bacillithiol biosynthesis deacetylase BshB1